MNGLLKQSTARAVSVQFVNSADSDSPATGIASFTVVAGKNGAAVGTITPTMTEQGGGWYSFALTSAHTDTLGDLCLTITPVSGADVESPIWQVVVDLPGGSVASVTAGVTLAAAAVQAIWDALTSALTTSGSIGKLLVDNINATISSRLASGSYTAPDNAGIAATLARTDVATSTRLAAGSYVAPDNATITAINAKTTNLPASPASEVTLNAVGVLATAINAKTTNLPANPASQTLLDVAVSTRASQASMDTAQGGIDSIETDIGALTTTADAIKAKTDNLPTDPASTVFPKNTAFNNFTFPMQDSNGDPVTGLTVTGIRSIDGAATAATQTVTEVGSGLYKFNMLAADLNGDNIAFVMSATGALQTKFTVVTEE